MDNFRCIAIETSTAQGSLALSSGSEILSRALDDTAVSSRQIFGMLDGLLKEAGLTPRDLDCIAFGCGPGSFTGVRVAAAAAQGLAFSTRLPVCRVSSLAALARNAVDAGATGRLLACVDARMGEAYIGGYRAAADGLHCELADRLVDPVEWRMSASNAEAVPVGPGWSVYPEMLPDGETTAYADVWPDAAAVLQLAHADYAAGNTVDPQTALPNYVRDNVTQ